MGRIMAIDYGAKRVGLAVTDPLKIIASPLETVHAKDILQYLRNYEQKEGIELFVVGMPYDLRNETTNATRLVEDFVLKLKKGFPGKEISLEDERYTSKMARRVMLEAGLKKKSRRVKETVDKISATIILQSYLEKHRL